jgi:hypothetical protein
MKRIVILIGLIVVLASLAAHGVGWEEERAGFQFRVNSRTGETEVGFYISMRYGSPPACMDITTDWTVYALGPPQEVMDAYTHHIRRNCSGRIASVSSLSPFVTPIPGREYGAKIIIRDDENNLVYERFITYTAPLGLPTGTSLNVSTPSGTTEGIDFSEVSDEELEPLVIYYNAFAADYVQTASDVLVGNFFSTYASSEEAFPSWVWVLAALGPDVNASGGGITIHMSYNRILFLYPISSSAAVAGVIEQLNQFDQEFIGRVLLKKEDAEGLGVASIFVGDDAWEALKAAATEWEKR